MDAKKKLESSSRKIGGKYCVARWCNNSRNSKPHLTFFQLPIKRDSNRAMLWLELADRDDLRAKPISYLRSQYMCADHFSDEMFMEISLKKRLKGNAIPKYFELPKRLLMHLHKKPETTNTQSDQCTRSSNQIYRAIVPRKLEGILQATKSAMQVTTDIPSVSYIAPTSAESQVIINSTTSDELCEISTDWPEWKDLFETLNTSTDTVCDNISDNLDFASTCVQLDLLQDEEMHGATMYPIFLRKMPWTSDLADLGVVFIDCPEELIGNGFTPTDQVSSVSMAKDIPMTQTQNKCLAQKMQLENTDKTEHFKQNIDEMCSKCQNMFHVSKIVYARNDFVGITENCSHSMKINVRRAQESRNEIESVTKCISCGNSKISPVTATPTLKIPSGNVVDQNKLGYAQEKPLCISMSEESHNSYPSIINAPSTTFDTQLSHKSAKDKADSNRCISATTNYNIDRHFSLERNVTKTKRITYFPHTSFRKKDFRNFPPPSKASPFWNSFTFQLNKTRTNNIRDTAPTFLIEKEHFQDSEDQDNTLVQKYSVEKWNSSESESKSQHSVKNIPNLHTSGNSSSQHKRTVTFPLNLEKDGHTKYERAESISTNPSEACILFSRKEDEQYLLMNLDNKNITFSNNSRSILTKHTDNTRQKQLDGSLDGISHLEPLKQTENRPFERKVNCTFNDVSTNTSASLSNMTMQPSILDDCLLDEDAPENLSVPLIAIPSDLYESALSSTDDVRK